ncbi:MAG: DUF4149 domain-containing protein [Candidatus Omnitrophica bacterium]|nr:DUF4149 domain-containing protein [Candidatus Omnitrophota bacterium]
MPTSGVWHLILWIHYLALAFWIGGITFFAAAVAPVIHRSMIAKALVGDVISKTLKRLNIIELTACLTLLATTISASHFSRGHDRYLNSLILLEITMGLTTLFYTYLLAPRMEALRDKIPTLDMLSSNQAVKIEYDRLHKIYVRLMSLNLALGMILLYASVAILK